MQVNNSHTDWRRTGSLYAVQDVKEVYVKDNEWFTEYFKVEGKHVIVKINDKTVVDYTEPDNVKEMQAVKVVYFQTVRLHCKAMIQIVKCISGILWCRYCRIEDRES